MQSSPECQETQINSQFWASKMLSFLLLSIQSPNSYLSLNVKIPSQRENNILGTIFTQGFRDSSHLFAWALEKDIRNQALIWETILDVGAILICILT